MPSIPLLLQNDQILYDALLQAGALSGGDFPPREFLLWQTGLSEEELQLALERFCQQKILQPAAGGSYTAFASRFSCIITIFAVLAKCWNIPTAPLQ